MFALSSDRAVDWTQAGYPGGIPVVTTVLANVKDDYGAVGNGTTDDTTAFTNAFAGETWDPNVPKVLFIPAGTYKITSELDPPSGCVMRGEGSDSTILKFYLGTSTVSKQCFKMYGSKGTTVGITSGATKGSTSIVVSSGTNFSGGNVIDIQQTNDTTWCSNTRDPTNYLAAIDDNWTLYCKGEMAVVTSKSGNTLYLDHPLHTTLDPAKSPTCGKVSPKQNIGWEYLTITRGDSTGGHESASWGANFFLKYSYKCWWKCVKSYKPAQHHMMLDRAYKFEVRQSYFFDFWDADDWNQTYGQTGAGYAIDLRHHCTACLIEDNTIKDCCMALGPSLGACGCFIGYNFVVQQNATAGATPGNGWCVDLEVHGWQAHHNLIEGNKVIRAGCAHYWGPCPNQVFHRNRVYSYMYVFDKSNNCTLTGNEVWGTNAGIHVSPYSGWPGTCTGVIKHGNDINGVVSWDSAYPDHGIPFSYRYTSAPSWWPSGLDWPVYGVGRDSPTPGVLPAEQRYLDGEPVPQGATSGTAAGRGSATLASPTGSGTGTFTAIGNVVGGLGTGVAGVDSPVGEGTGTIVYWLMGSGGARLASPTGSGVGSKEKTGITTVTCYVDPDGGGVGSYESLKAAFDDGFGATGVDLVANDERIRVYCRPSGTSIDTGGFFDLTGFTTDYYHDIVIEVPTGSHHAGKWVESDSFYRISPASGPCISVTNNYVTLRNIAFGLTVGADDQYCAYSAGDYVVWDRCIFKARSYGTATDAICGLEVGNKITTVQFCIATDFSLTNSYGFYRGGAGSAVATFLNCLAYSCTTGFRRNSGSMRLRNCIGCTNSYLDFWGAVWDAGCTNNLSEDDTAPGTEPLTGMVPSEFVSASTYDFRIANTKAKAYRSGSQGSLTLGGTYYDLGQNRMPTTSGSWDRGPHQYQEAAPGGIVIPPSISTAKNLRTVAMVRPQRPGRAKLRKEAQQRRRLRAVWSLSKRMFFTK